MHPRVVVVAAVALIGLLGGCSGGDQPTPAATTAAQTPAASPAASTSSPASPSSSSAPSSSPSSSSEPPTSKGRKVTAAGGALSWTMPCKPDSTNISGNEEDKKTYRSSRGWSCGKRGAATSGVFLVELIKKPADPEAADRALRTAVQQLAPKSKPTDDDLAGTPGVSGTSTQNGKKFGYQGISFGSYLAIFIALPPKDLKAITDTVQVS